MSGSFTYDVFLSHSSNDQRLAETITRKLERDGLRVWFGKTTIPAGSSIMRAIEEGLQNSRSLVLLISASALASDWVSLERNTILFRDPANRERRFIPVLVDEAHNSLPDTLRQYRYIDYRRKSRAAYRELLRACARNDVPIKMSKPPETPSVSIVTLQTVLREHHSSIKALALTPDGRKVVAGYSDGSLSLWNLDESKKHAHLDLDVGYGEITSIAVSTTGSFAIVGNDLGNIYTVSLTLEKVVRTTYCNIKKGPDYARGVTAIAWFPQRHQFLTGNQEGQLSLWDAGTGKRIKFINAHHSPVSALSILPDGSHVFSASNDTIAIWDVSTWTHIGSMQDHSGDVTALACFSGQKRLVSGSNDCTVKLWDYRVGRCLATLEGHLGSVDSVLVHPSDVWLASASDDAVKVWDASTGSCLQTIVREEQSGQLAITVDGKALAVGSPDGSVGLYQIAGVTLRPPVKPSRDEYRYTNAKVVLVGESGIGKSCLAYRLVENTWFVEESTHGMRVWPLKLLSASQARVVGGIREGKPARTRIERELWLWDLAGQPDYRIVHQLFLDETSLALVLFDPSEPDDPFGGLAHWEKSLRLAVGREYSKILVGTKSDRNAAAVSQDKIKHFCLNHGYSAYIPTSAKTGGGRDELLNSIAKHIPWQNMPWITTSTLFKQLKDEIIRLRDENITLIPFAALRQQLQLRLRKKEVEEEELRTVVRLLAGAGLVKCLAFGDMVLLKPELMNNYAASVVRAAREHADDVGVISESAVLSGDFDLKDMSRLPKHDEEILLRAVVHTFLDQSLCIREETQKGGQLIFPSQFNRELELPSYPVKLVTYRFAGHLPTIYATLVVRLRYSKGFEEPVLWKNAAVFRDKRSELGLRMKEIGEGVGEIGLFFSNNVSLDTRVVFLRYIHEHLKRHAVSVERLRHYTCPKKTCGQIFKDLEAIRARMERGISFARCNYCDTEIPLVDVIEKKFAEDAFEAKVRKLDVEAGINLSGDSSELVVTGQAFAIANEGGHEFRPCRSSSMCIGGELLLRRSKQEPKRILLILRTADVFYFWRADTGKRMITVRLRSETANEEKRQKKERRIVREWRESVDPVYIVLRREDGAVHWMNITEALRKSKEFIMEFEFSGEPFTTFSVLRRSQD